MGEILHAANPCSYNICQIFEFSTIELLVEKEVQPVV